MYQCHHQNLFWIENYVTGSRQMAKVKVNLWLSTHIFVWF